ncbi:MAG: amidohydrolase family protein, partial [Clostridiales bacterium]|nr:amidohydrolase family protein [Clostridiales bacterium]
MTIDFHSHIYPDKIADKAARNVGDFYSLKVSCDGTAGMLLEKGSAAGIDKYVVHSVAQLPSQVESINNFISSMSASHPEFVGFGALHKDTPNPADEIGRIISLGLQGVKLHPDVQKFEMDDCAMLEIYSMLEGSLPVLIHCGDYRTTYSHPARLARILDLF